MSDPITLAFIADELQQHRQQLIVITKLLAELLNLNEKQWQAQHPPKTIQLHDGGVMIRQLIDDAAGYVVTRTDADGAVVDQAIQDARGDWWSFSTDISNKITLQERRDAVRAG
jgi:hypothetical protein